MTMLTMTALRCWHVIPFTPFLVQCYCRHCLRPTLYLIPACLLYMVLATSLKKAYITIANCAVKEENHELE